MKKIHKHKKKIDLTGYGYDELVQMFPDEVEIYVDMHRRCYDPTHPRYPNEGARGIRVCERWNANNFEGFRNFLEDMGPIPSRGNDDA